MGSRGRPGRPPRHVGAAECGRPADRHCLMNTHCILHIDVNSAFLSWEAAYRVHEKLDPLDLRTVPSVIGGDEKSRHGIVLAKSQPAKKYGIKTGEPLVDARKKCPSLIVVPPDYPLYVECSRRLIRYLSHFSGRVDQYSIDEAFLDLTGTEHLYGGPVLFANELREMIAEEFGFTVNVGVSSNRLLAKMAGELKKPNRTISLFPEEIPDKLWPMPVEELFFVGHVHKKRLRTLGIRTIGELAAADPDVLAAHFKSYGRLIHALANGQDTPVFTAVQEENKGYGNAATVPCDITSYWQADRMLLSLTETVAARIRADEKKIGCVAVSICTWQFERFSHQRVLGSPTDVTFEIYETASALFREMWDGVPIRQLGVHTNRVGSEEAYQFGLFDRIPHDRLMRADRAVDRIREKMGEQAVMRACFLSGPVRQMAGGLHASRRTGITKKIADPFPEETGPA